MTQTPLSQVQALISPLDLRRACGQFATGVTIVTILEGVAAALVCEVTAVHPAGDHSLFIGEVKQLEWAPDREPLLFHGGQYRGLDRPEAAPGS